MGASRGGTEKNFVSSYVPLNPVGKGETACEGTSLVSNIPRRDEDNGAGTKAAEPGPERTVAALGGIGARCGRVGPGDHAPARRGRVS